MQMAPYVQALQEDLANAASLAGDEAAQEAGRRLAQALEPSLQLRLLDLLSEIALSLNSQVPGRVEVRLAGREPELVYVEEEEAEPAAPPDDALTARITLRISDSLKGQIELAAARESLSVNSWIVRALARGLETRSVRAGRRLTGFARAERSSDVPPPPDPYGAGVLLVPDYCAPQIPVHDERIVIPTAAAEEGKRDA